MVLKQFSCFWEYATFDLLSLRKLMDSSTVLMVSGVGLALAQRSCVSYDRKHSFIGSSANLGCNDSLMFSPNLEYLLWIFPIIL